jgi:hypothetical protein
MPTIHGNDKRMRAQNAKRGDAGAVPEAAALGDDIRSLSILRADISLLDKPTPITTKGTKVLEAFPSCTFVALVVDGVMLADAKQKGYSN